ncbi:MAG: hypothetical protein ACK4Y7_05735 [Caldimicrobium sp.]
MSSDIFATLSFLITSVVLKSIGIILLIGLIIFDFLFRRRRSSIAVPILFTTEKERQKARRFYDSFTKSHRLKAEFIENVTSIRQDDMVIQLDHDPRTQSDPKKPIYWQEAWKELLNEWVFQIDHRLKQDLPSGERFCYHICPHIRLPLAFAMGASVGLRRRIVLYHCQQDEFFRVLDLNEPRRLFVDPVPTIPPPKRVPESFDTLPSGEKLILHLCISDRQDVPEFRAHPEYDKAVCAGLVYEHALDPKKDWLGYVQWLYRESKPFIGRYQK